MVWLTEASALTLAVRVSPLRTLAELPSPAASQVGRQFAAVLAREPDNKRANLGLGWWLDRLPPNR
jgi:hypothetical protein